MSVIKVASKKAKSGYTYKVTFKYKEYGVTQSYSKSGFIRKKDAQDHETQVKAQIKRDGYLHRECTKTVNDVYEEFLEVGTSKYRHNTLVSIKMHYNKHIMNALGMTPIVKLDYQTLQKYFNSIVNQGKRTNDMIYYTLNNILNYAIKIKYLKYNQISLVDVKGAKKSKKIPQKDVISYTEFESIFLSLREKNEFKHQALAVSVAIGYYTGLRIGEIFALEKKDIDFEMNTININKNLIYLGLKRKDVYASNQTKTNYSESIIPLAKPLKQILLEWFEINPYDKILCDIEGIYLCPKNDGRIIKRIAKKIGIDFHFHMLRHTFITNLVTNNIDVKTVQELARHGDINTTMNIYTHIQEGQKRKAINNVFSKNYSKNTLNSKLN